MEGKDERRNLKKKIIITKIPETIKESYEEVDTLQEFLTEFDLTEEQLRIAAKEYVEDKVTQPRATMDDLLRVINLGVVEAEKVDKGKEKKVEIFDPYVADALVNRFGWLCEKVSSNPDRYILQRS